MNITVTTIETMNHTHVNYSQVGVKSLYSGTSIEAAATALYDGGKFDGESDKVEVTGVDADTRFSVQSAVWGYAGLLEHIADAS